MADKSSPVAWALLASVAEPSAAVESFVELIELAAAFALEWERPSSVVE